MALPANAITLTLSDASTKIVYIQSQTFNWKTGHTFIQWAEITPSGQTYVRNSPDAVLEITTSQAASVTYMNLTLANQLIQLNTALTAYYNNLITSAATLNI